MDFVIAKTSESVHAFQSICFNIIVVTTESLRGVSWCKVQRSFSSIDHAFSCMLLFCLAEFQLYLLSATNSWKVSCANADSSVIYLIPFSASCNCSHVYFRECLVLRFLPSNRQRWWWHMAASVCPKVKPITLLASHELYSGFAFIGTIKNELS